jgi:hypothetical protein
MIRFSCPRCMTLLEAPDGDAGSERACPQCQQRFEVPHTLHTMPAATAPPPVNAPLIVPPSVVASRTLDREKIDRLRQLQNARLPGNVLAAVGFPILFAVPLFFMCISFAVVGGQRNTNSHPQSASEGSFLSGCLCCFVPLLWAGGSAGLVLARKKLNTSFVRKNTIRLDYSLSHEMDLRYKILLRSLDELAASEMYEIVQSDGSSYYESTPVCLQTVLSAIF